MIHCQEAGEKKGGEVWWCEERGETRERKEEEEEVDLSLQEKKNRSREGKRKEV